MAEARGMNEDLPCCYGGVAVETGLDGRDRLKRGRLSFKLTILETDVNLRRQLLHMFPFKIG